MSTNILWSSPLLWSHLRQQSGFRSSVARSRRIRSEDAEIGRQSWSSSSLPVRHSCLFVPTLPFLLSQLWLMCESALVCLHTLAGTSQSWQATARKTLLNSALFRRSTTRHMSSNVWFLVARNYLTLNKHRDQEWGANVSGFSSIMARMELRTHIIETSAQSGLTERVELWNLVGD